MGKGRRAEAGDEVRGAERATRGWGGLNAWAAVGAIGAEVAPPRGELGAGAAVVAGVVARLGAGIDNGDEPSSDFVGDAAQEGGAGDVAHVREQLVAEVAGREDSAGEVAQLEHRGGGGGGGGGARGGGGGQ